MQSNPGHEKKSSSILDAGAHDIAELVRRHGADTTLGELLNQCSADASRGPQLSLFGPAPAAQVLLPFEPRSASALTTFS